MKWGLLRRFTINNWSSCCVSHYSICLRSAIFERHVLHHITLNSTFSWLSTLTIIYSSNWISLVVLNLVIHGVHISSVVSRIISNRFIVWFLVVNVGKLSSFLLRGSLCSSSNKNIRLSFGFNHWLLILLVPWWLCSILIIGWIQCLFNTCKLINLLLLFSVLH